MEQTHEAVEHQDDAGPAAVLIAYYESARAELVQRIQLRDQSLVLFVGAVGVLATAALSNFGSGYAMLFAVPYVGLGATFVSMQHHCLIGALGSYCGTELAEHLHRHSPAFQWDESNSLGRTAPLAFGHRLRGHLLLLVGPQCAAVAIGLYGFVEHVDRVQASDAPLLGAVIVGGLLPALYSALLIRRSHHDRNEIARGGGPRP